MSRRPAGGKYVDGTFSDQLVTATARAYREHWHPEPAPSWVTALPSSTRRGLVDGFARALARRLDLLYVECLTVRDDAEPQMAMQNSVQQLRNAHDKLGILDEAVPTGPVLLVDDIVASGWTMTVAGWLLRSHGSGQVHPFALAVARTRARLATLVRRRTPAKTDSIGLLVRRCSQCSAGKS